MPEAALEVNTIFDWVIVGVGGNEPITTTVPTKEYTILESCWTSALYSHVPEVEGISMYVAVVKPGRILYELGGLPENVAREALKLAQAKLSVKTRIISKDQLN